MGYIVYIPAGADTFTQKSFATMKELAKWAMNEALDKTAPSVTVSPSVVAVDPSRKGFTSGRQINELTPAIQEKPAEPVWNVDTSTWFAEDSSSPYKECLKLKLWNDVAYYYLDFFHKKCWKRATTPKSIPHELIHFFYRLCKKYPARMMEELEGDTEVHWDELPPEFWAVCDKQICSNFKYTITRYEPTYPLLAQINRIYQFFFNNSHSSYWNAKNINLAGIHWKDAQRLTEHLVQEWYAGNKARDEIHEFMIKMVIGRNYDGEPSKDKTVGAAEFMEDFKRLVSQLDLPEEFLAWATKGVQHRHCKEALEELGIQQVRRAEGQRYVGIRLLPDLVGSAFSLEFAADELIVPYADGGLAPFNGEIPFLPSHFFRVDGNTVPSGESVKK
jgi:hypothetical protein